MRLATHGLDTGRVLEARREVATVVRTVGHPVATRGGIVHRLIALVVDERCNAADRAVVEARLDHVADFALCSLFW